VLTNFLSPLARLFPPLFVVLTVNKISQIYVSLPIGPLTMTIIPKKNPKHHRPNLIPSRTLPIASLRWAAQSVTGWDVGCAAKRERVKSLCLDLLFLQDKCNILHWNLRACAEKSPSKNNAKGKNKQ